MSPVTSQISVSDPRKTLRRRLLDVVQQQIIPTLEGRDLWQAFLAEPPFQFPREVTFNYHSGKPLLAKEATGYAHNSVLHYWPSAKVHSARSPYMGFILEGEIDFRIGITAEMARTAKGDSAHCDYVLLGIPKSTFFLMPPGVPYSNSEQNHWERKPMDQATFQVFWIRFVPQGVLCHFCWATPEGMAGETDYYIHDPQLLFVANALIDELRQRGHGIPSGTNALLLFIFYRLSFALQKLNQLRPGSVHKEIEKGNVMGTAVELACRYIEGHLHEKFNLDEIAAHSFTSKGHLCRIFHAEKGVTINQFITHQRLENACSLLRGSSLPIGTVAHSVGYSSSAYFCRQFARHFHISPLQFRQRHLQEYQKNTINVKKVQK